MESFCQICLLPFSPYINCFGRTMLGRGIGKKKEHSTNQRNCSLQWNFSLILIQIYHWCKHAMPQLTALVPSSPTGCQTEPKNPLGMRLAHSLKLNRTTPSWRRRVYHVCLGSRSLTHIYLDTRSSSSRSQAIIGSFTRKPFNFTPSICSYQTLVVISLSVWIHPSIPRHQGTCQCWCSQ